MSRPLRLLGLAALILALFLFLVSRESLAAQTSGVYFYYAAGLRVPLTLDASHVTVRFKSGVPPAARRAAEQQTDEVDTSAPAIENGSQGATILSVLPGRDPLAAAGRLRARPEVEAAGPVYRFPDGALYGETDEFIGRFKPDLDSAAIDRLNAASGVEIARPQPYSKSVFILRGRPGNPRSARELANAYVEKGWVDFAEPNFLIVQPRGGEPALPSSTLALPPPSVSYFGLQWSLENTGQFQGALPGADIRARAAWGSTEGASQITIAVIDEGVDHNQLELQGKLLPGINVTVEPNDQNTDPDLDNYHGTAAAGIAAARSTDGTGIAGVCWFCSILPVKVAFEDVNGNWITTTAQLAAGIDWAWQNGADILSNSWVMSGPSDTVKAAILNARFGGRPSGQGALGSTLVFAVGNEDGAGISFPASMNKFVIAVGASNWCDQRKTRVNDPARCNNADPAWGSNYGPSLDLIAPGEAILATCNGARCFDRSTPGEYFTYFYGTSASTPMVAGAVGLLYSLNPNLSPTDVLTALQSGAKRLPPTPPDTGSGYYRLQAADAIASLYDLSLTAVSSRQLVDPGDSIQYTFTYRNTGLTAMPKSVLRVSLPPGLTYSSSNPPFTLNGQIYELNLGTLPRYALNTATMTVQVQPGTDGQSLDLQAWIAGQFPELDMADNSTVTSVGVADAYLFLPLILH